MRHSRTFGVLVGAALACTPSPPETAGSEATGGTTSTGGGDTQTSSGDASTAETSTTSSSGAETTTTGAACGDGIAEEGELCFEFVEAEINVGDRVRLADLDEDGNLDVVSTLQLCPATPVPARPSAFASRSDSGMWPRGVPRLLTAHGDGLGGFTGVLDEDFNGWTLAVADVDGDGHVDLITSIYPPAIQTHFGAGDGSFALAEPVPVPYELYDNVPADLDGDGDVDLVGYGPEGIAALLGDGAGGFTALPAFGADEGFVRRRLKVVDLDDDGALDLLIRRADYHDAAEIERWMGVGDGTFVAAEPTVLEYGAASFAVVASTPKTPAYVLVLAEDETMTHLLRFEVQGDGSLAPPVVSVEDCDANMLLLGRLDGGPSEDAALLSGGRVDVLHGEPPWSPPPTTVAEGVFYIWSDIRDAGDLNGDGVDDFVLGGGVLLSNP